MKKQIISELQDLLARSHAMRDDYFYAYLIDTASKAPQKEEFSAERMAADLQGFHARKPVTGYGNAMTALSERKNILIVTASKENNEAYRIDITGSYQECFLTNPLLGRYSHPIKGIGCDNIPAIIADCTQSHIKLSANCKHYPFKTRSGNGIVIDLNEVKLDIEKNSQNKAGVTINKIN